MTMVDLEKLAMIQELKDVKRSLESERLAKEEGAEINAELRAVNEKYRKALLEVQEYLSHNVYYREKYKCELIDKVDEVLK